MGRAATRCPTMFDVPLLVPERMELMFVFSKLVYLAE
jgi:hypothetical protein